MTASIKVLIAAGALTFVAAAPAAADYTILQDSSLPSVLFVEFDGGPAPKVISASGDEGGEQSVSLGDPALPQVSGDNNSSASNQNEGGTSVDVEVDETAADDGDSGKSVDERVDDKISELENASQEKIEDIVIDRAIEDEILEGTDLR